MNDRRQLQAIALGAVLAVAAGLRLLHLTWGLPSVLEEAMPLRVALRMIDPATGHIHFNPGFFNYPSLSIYLHLAGLQVLYTFGHLLGHYHSAADFVLSFNVDPTPMLVMGRLIHAAADLATVWVAYRIGRRFSVAAGWLALVLAACSPLLLQTARTIAVDTMATALLMWSVERLLAWQSTAKPHALYTAAVLMGLAASTKYPMIVFVVPMLVSIALHARERRVVLALAVCGIAACTFLATSPFLVLDLRSALRDIGFERQHLAMGHLGSEQHVSALYHLLNLARGLGPLGIALFFLSPLLCLDPRHRSTALPLLLLCGLVLGPIAVARFDAERYLLPVVPLAGALVGAMVTVAVARIRPNRQRLVLSVVAACVLVPVIVEGAKVGVGGTQDTQELARRWCVQHIASDAMIVAEGWSVPLTSITRKMESMSSPDYRYASARAQQQLAALPAFRVISIPVRVTGTVPAPVGNRSVAAIDLNRAYYTLGLYPAADYIVTSSATRGRYASNPARFGVQVAFYGLLDSLAEEAATFRSNRWRSGPEIRIYRATPEWRAALRVRPLASTWWVGEGVAAGAAPSSSPDARMQWQRYYDGCYRAFADELTYLSLVRGDTVTAEALAKSGLAVDPGNVQAAIVFSLCSGSRGAWREARDVLEAALRGNPDDTALLLRLARVEARLRRPQRQKEYLLRVRAMESASSPLRVEAESELSRLAAN